MDHKCHWPGCDIECESRHWGCVSHWFKLPKTLRNRIWDTYRRGQEIDKRPSEQYIEAAQDVQAWIAEYQANGNAPPERDTRTLDLFSGDK